MAPNKEQKKNASTEQRLADDMVRRVVRLVADIRKRQAAMVQNYGVTILQYSAIQALKDGGALNITQLARKLHLNQSTVSSLVDRMERDDLVRRVQSSEDRRSVKLRLTDKAYEVTETLPVAPFDFFKLLLKKLTPDEQRLLAGIMVKLEGAFDEQIAAIDARQAAAAKRKQSAG